MNNIFLPKGYWLEHWLHNGWIISLRSPPTMNGEVTCLLWTNKHVISSVVISLGRFQLLNYGWFRIFQLLYVCVKYFCGTHPKFKKDSLSSFCSFKWGIAFSMLLRENQAAVNNSACSLSARPLSLCVDSWLTSSHINVLMIPFLPLCNSTISVSLILKMNQIFSLPEILW